MKRALAERAKELGAVLQQLDEIAVVDIEKPAKTAGIVLERVPKRVLQSTALCIHGSANCGTIYCKSQR